MLRNSKLISSAILVALLISSLPGLLVARNHSDHNTRSYPHRLTYNLDNASASAAETEKKQPTVAILLFDGVQIIDYSGPWEVFGQAGFEVHTVTEKSEPVTTRFGKKVLADYTFDNSPKADILLLPGGRGTLKAADNPRVIKWIQANAKDDRYVMSVCTGA